MGSEEYCSDPADPRNGGNVAEAAGTQINRRRTGTIRLSSVPLGLGPVATDKLYGFIPRPNEITSY